MGLGVKHPEVGASRWAWRSIGNPNFFLRSRFFSRPPAPAWHSASLPVIRKNQLTSPFFIALGEKEPSTNWEARHQVSGLMRRTKLTLRSWLLAQQGGALPYRTAGARKVVFVVVLQDSNVLRPGRIRTSLPADHCRPII